MAERLRSRIASELTLDDVPENITITITLGISSFPEDGKNPNNLIVKADEALYEGKRMGKNRVVIYEGK